MTNDNQKVSWRNIMDYDVLILGGGIIGCAAAYELSKYSLNIALIEKNYDIADDVALVNASIVYNGLECEDSLTSKLEFQGNRLIDEITEKFNVPFKRCGSLTIASHDEEISIIDTLYERAKARGIHNVSILDSNKVYEMEPNLNISVKKALYSEDFGVICPYDLAIAYGEVAFDNGVNFKLEEEVLDIQKVSRGFKVITNKNKFTCKMVINTTPGINYSIDSSDKEAFDDNKTKLNYFILDRSFNNNFSNILFTFNKEGERTYAVPTVQGNNIAAMTTKNNLDYLEVVNKVEKLVSGLKEEHINTYYQTSFNMEPIIIDDSAIDKGYIKVTGKHYAQVTMTPYIAKIVCETIVSNLNCVLKKDFVDKRRDFYRFRELNNEERNKIIQMDDRYAKMICICQQVSEGEIVDAIRRPLGARTVEGIKRRTGVILGNCQGAYCLNKIVSILAKETNKNITEIVKDSKSAKVILGRIKEFEGI